MFIFKTTHETFEQTVGGQRKTCTTIDLRYLLNLNSHCYGSTNYLRPLCKHTFALISMKKIS